jgi:hypothetical protein
LWGKWETNKNREPTFIFDLILLAGLAGAALFERAPVYARRANSQRQLVGTMIFS